MIGFNDDVVDCDHCTVLEKIDGRLTDDKLTSSHHPLIILTQIGNVQGWRA